MSTTDFQPSERLRQMRDDVVYLEGELRSLNDTAADRNFEADEQTRWDEGSWLRHALIAEGIDLEARERATAEFNAGSFERGDSNQPASGPAFHREVDTFSEEHIRSVGPAAAAERAVDENRWMNSASKERITSELRAARTDPIHSRGMDEYILAHSSEDYTRGWAKLVTERGWAMTDAEKAAMLRAQEYQQRFDPERAITLTAANGGALIPAHLDPTIVVVNEGSSNPYRAISNVVKINTNTWNGVTSAGVTFAWSTEGGDSSDIAPTFGQKAITVFKAHGTVPVTIEAFEDIDGLTSQLPAILQDGKDRLEVAAFTNGSGSGQPKGIVTAVAAESSRIDQHATNSSMTVTDVVDAQNLLGPRFQPNASWIGSLTYLNRVRLLGSSSYSTWSRRLDEGLSQYEILGKRAYEVSTMSTALSTATNTAFVYGDFGFYNIVDRIGMSIEYVPHLFSTGNGLPNGRRGFYAYWRVGADAVSTTAFVLSQNPGA